MRLCDDASERVPELGIDQTLVRELIERLRLVKTAHLHRPLDRLAPAIKRETLVRNAGDRHHAAIDVGRVGAVDVDLGLAGGLAFLQSREIEKGKLDRPFDLEHALGREENHRRMSIDARDFATAVRRRIGQQREDFILRIGDVAHATSLAAWRLVAGSPPDGKPIDPPRTAPKDFAAHQHPPRRTACSSMFGHIGSNPARPRRISTSMTSMALPRRYAISAHPLCYLTVRKRRAQYGGASVGL